MQALDVNSLFARAERAFAAGQADAARADLLQVQRLAGDHPAVLHLLALVEKKRGELDASRSAFERALRLAPNDPQINNNFANLLDRAGDLEAALLHFDKALLALPGFADARYNRALLLQRLGRLEDALAELDQLAATSPPSAKLLSARASLLRQLGRLDEAAQGYDAALAIEPRRATALHGRARTALERGDANASEHYRRALQGRAGDRALLLGLAEALELEGKPGAIDCLAAAVAKDPNWVEGQGTLARMRWEAGEGLGFTRAIEGALRASPSDWHLWFAYASALASANLSREAAEAAQRGREVAEDDGRLQLLEAVSLSEAGEIKRANLLFETLPNELAGRQVHHMRHLLRLGDFVGAHDMAEQERARDPWNVGVWAMLGLLWRLLDDPRAHWLHEQPGLVSTPQLDLSAGDIEAIAERLRGLHRTRAHPIGQSLRGGTQTRGRLFERGEEEVLRLRKALERAVADYWVGLPAPDVAHPLLRHRLAKPRFEGSWSVRLTDGGFHVAHVHPHGVLSSACYLAVPPAAEQEGWLEIGAPPENLRLPLAPLRRVEPRPGLLALFPSTLYHGTRPFAAGERLTAAFDVVAG